MGQGRQGGAQGWDSGAGVVSKQGNGTGRAGWRAKPGGGSSLQAGRLSPGKRGTTQLSRQSPASEEAVGKNKGAGRRPRDLQDLETVTWCQLWVRRVPGPELRPAI